MGGDPTEIRDVLPGVLNGTWDVEAARRRWRAAVSDEAIANLLIVRDATDALVAGKAETALGIIEAGERNAPSLRRDAEFSILKLQALTGLLDREYEAARHYATAAIRFADDLRAQIRLAATVVRALKDNETAMRTAVKQLAAIGDGPAETANDAAFRLWCRLLEAEASITLGSTDDALIALDRADVLARVPNLPQSAKGQAATEIERLRALADKEAGIA